MSEHTGGQSLGSSLLATILADESYRPSEPATLTETGLPISLIEGLLIKRLAVVGICSGRQLSNDLCLPFNALEQLFQQLRARQIIVHKGSAPLNDYNYSLTETGRDRAAIATQACSYVGAAPVPLMDYVLSAEAQTIRAESPKRAQLRNAFKNITVDENLFESLGPAINSGAGLFLYGEPGNGKSTLASCITRCFGHEIWIPHAIYEDGQIIKFYDAAYHQFANNDEDTMLSATSFDRRWIKIRRPTVVVGGEMTMDALEIRHDPNSNVSEASLQMKSNCGCLLIDDFGRQRIEPGELLNRWIVPLESRVDFLTLSSGKKIQVPFEQLIIFSTNLEPSDLVDEAFLRRIPYKIEISDPSVEEFHQLFEIYCEKFECEYEPRVVDYLVSTHFLNAGRRLRRCHPRDLLSQIRNFCTYNELPMEIRPEYFDRVVNSYFTVVIDSEESPKTTSTTAAGEILTQAPAPRKPEAPSPPVSISPTSATSAGARKPDATMVQQQPGPKSLTGPQPTIQTAIKPTAQPAPQRQTPRRQSPETMVQKPVVQQPEHRPQPAQPAPVRSAAVEQTSIAPEAQPKPEFMPTPTFVMPEDPRDLPRNMSPPQQQ